MAAIQIDHPLISADAITEKVRELAQRINLDYADRQRPLSVIVVLKGAAFFAIDLLKHLDLDTRIDFMQASSYSGTDSSGEIRLINDISLPIAGTDVLLVEDIVDTGLTADWLLKHLKSHEPESVKLCALLQKPSRRRVPVTIDYEGFSIPDEFVLGYGLDYDEHYRHLPAIYVASKTQ